MKKQIQRFILALILVGSLCEAAPGTLDLSSLDTNRFVVVNDLESQVVPLMGWQVKMPETEPGVEMVPGIRIDSSQVEVAGVKYDALILSLTTGSFPNSKQPCIELPFAFDANTFNVMRFQARVDVPDGLQPLLGRREVPKTGWYSYQFNRFFDNFGIAVYDSGFDWTAVGVPTTHFLNHVDRTQPGPGGFLDFQWDLRYEDPSGNKSFDRTGVTALRFFYDTRKIPEGKTVVVTITGLQLLKGAHIRFDEPERFAAWTNFTAAYSPDYSDAKRFLEPPEKGRLARPLPLARGGKAQAEIIVDFSDASAITNFIAPDKLTLEARVALGHELDVMRLAGAELKRWLDQVTGADFPFLATPSSNPARRIFLGAGFARKHFAADLAALTATAALDGYAIREKGGDLYIFGVLPKGTLNGIYAFLENNTDLIWALPNEAFGTVFTPKPDLDAVWGDVRDSPVFVLRGWLSPEPWLRYNRCNFTHLGKMDTATRGDYAEVGGHCLSLHSGRFGREAYARFHPMIDGERPEVWSEYKHLTCLTHPELFDVDLASRKEYIDRNELLALRIGVDDSWGICQCETCSAPITLKDGRVVTPENFNEFYSAWFYRYLNRMADALAKWRPGFTTSTYAYFMAAPPPLELSPNIRPWLCPYVRKAQNQPLIAPINQHWWRMLSDWSKVCPGIVYRDYYGLCLSIYPLAEVLAADLRTMRDIGALRITTEGFATPFGDDLGAAEEKWVISRLYWNPDADVEQLRKYYLQRTFREAAPAMERFRGEIRRAWYQKADFNLDFEEMHETAGLIRKLGIDAELRGYLAEASKTVRHPGARVLVERAVAAFDAYMKGETLKPEPAPKSVEESAWAERKNSLSKVAVGDAVAVRTLFDGILTEPELTLEQQVEIRVLYAKALTAAKEPQAARTLIEQNLNDPRLERSVRIYAFQQLFADGVRLDADFTSDQTWAALEAFRAVRINSVWGDPADALAVALASSLAKRGDVAGGARLLERNRDLPGRSPADRAERQQELRDYWREAAKRSVDGADAALTREQERLIATWRVAEKDEITADGRAIAAYNLLEDTWEGLNVKQRRAQVDALIGNPWIDNALRAKAAKKIPLIYLVGEKTDWAATVDHVWWVLDMGDWSGREFGRDDKHALVCETAIKLIEAGETVRAHQLLEKAIPMLGYDGENGDPKRREQIQTLYKRSAETGA